MSLCIHIMRYHCLEHQFKNICNERSIIAQIQMIQFGILITDKCALAIVQVDYPKI